ncbi:MULTISPECIES: GGDEF domain-containing protein [Alteromonadaceae]|uniref:GGDEF domain-containing protein n=1 Tax=Alteromonadaceae TaxID=72275 RepID=UPI001C0A1D6D|nr:MULTISPECIES: GGDEF domain-containing protein [Aliiglaciecola]MBU2879424.1 GGDEF domain-containing protein [Aliiglaciecola lipolytica]MDO6712466.1 GGDEF domain-containing protein [Aliiglaciecola sp. 2_MG-2023]MDO6753476.1 GGDEF domain-containing protein [Aliiglaciecola sp. 1_MG-2023]
MITHSAPIKKRSAEESIILTLSGASTIGVLPFAIYRIMEQDWAVACLDLFAVFAIGSLFVYVYRTHQTLIPGRILAFVAMFVVFVTILLKGISQLMWIFPALTAIFFLLPANMAAIYSLVILLSIGYVLREQLTVFLALEFYVTAIATLLFSYAFADRMRKQQQQLTELATSDPLTGAGNRRAMEEKLLDVIAFQRREQSLPVSLILMDLDNFKKVNDAYGHAKGDDILKAFVETIEKRIRSTDKLYRFGGEEFVIIAENTPLKDAIKLAEQFRFAIENEGWLAKHNITISVGTAKYEPHETAFEWLGRADRAMYQAKDLGRNNCCVA